MTKRSIIILILATLFVHLVYSNWFDLDYALSSNQLIKIPMMLVIFVIMILVTKIVGRRKFNRIDYAFIYYPLTFGIPIALMSILYNKFEIDIENGIYNLDYSSALNTILIFYIVTLIIGFFLYGSLTKKQKPNS